MNICGENHHLRQARKRYAQCYDDSAKHKLTCKKDDFFNYI